MSEFSHSASAVWQEKMLRGTAALALALPLGVTACTRTESPEPNPTLTTHQTPDTDPPAVVSGPPEECAGGIPTPLDITIPDSRGNIRASYSKNCAVEVRDPSRPNAQQIALGPHQSFEVICLENGQQLLIQRTVDRMPVLADVTPAAVNVFKLITQYAPNNGIPNCDNLNGAESTAPSRRLQPTKHDYL